MTITMKAANPQKGLTVRGLSKTYGKQVHALDGVTFSIGKGIFGLLGPNGAGKSTLMNILATIVVPDEGTIHFQGHSVLHDPALVRRTLGFLPQAFGVYARTTAWQLLDYIAILKGIGPKAARHQQMEELLALTHLSADKNRPVAQFSGGMKQRFGLAQALLGDPKLLIVDEPTAGLDPYERNHFHQVISDLAKHRIMILSTHLVADVANLCANILILKGGKVQFCGPPRELLSGLAGRVWATVCSADQIAGLEKQYPVLSIRFKAGERLAHVWAQEKPPGFEPVTPDLEDAYFAVLKRGGDTCGL